MQQSIKNNKDNYRADIDGLRAIAVLSVTAFHAFPAWMKGGFIGVDIFFVISGYLITKIILEQIENKKFSFSDFYTRRINRIFPALITVLISSYIFGWFALFPDEFKQLGKHIAAGSVYISNLILWSESGYFDNSAESKPLLHLWSLGIEEQFYIFWPIILWLIWKFKYNVITITAVIAAISFYLNIKLIHTNPTATFYSPLTRAWELLCGSILAWLVLYKNDFSQKLQLKSDFYLTKIIYSNKTKTNKNITLNFISAIGLALLVYGFCNIEKSSLFPGKWAIPPVLGAFLIILAGPQAWINKYVFSNRIAVWIGLISFPLYLWHWPLLSFARIIEGGIPDRSIRISAILISILLAWLTYRFIETPLRHGKGGRLKTIALISLMVVVGYIGYNSFNRDGLSFRFNKIAERNELYLKPSLPVVSFGCRSKIPEFSKIEFKSGCNLSKDEDPTILFVGDSHTGHYRNAIWDNFKNEPILMIVETSCLPFSNDGFLVGNCKEKYSAIIDYISNNKSIKTIVLSGYWAYLISGGFERQEEGWRIPKQPSKENIESFKRNANHFISKSIENKKNIVLLKDIPDLDFNIKQCYEDRPVKITKSKIIKNCYIDENDFIKRASIYDNVIEDILKKHPSIKTFDTRKVLCKQGKCFGADDNFPYYFNGDHVNRYGAKIIINELIKEQFTEN